MYVSFFKLFKIGIGPSSSHTVGPINAANSFIQELLSLGRIKEKIKRLNIHLYGSLALTGKGHGTDLGLVAGLLGYKPNNVNIFDIRSYIDKNKNTIDIESLDINFDLNKDLIFDYKSNTDAVYSNKMIFSVFGVKRDFPLLSKTYYSVGGGFVLEDSDTKEEKKDKVTYNYDSAKELLEIGFSNDLSITDIVLKNEQDLAKDIELEELKKKVIDIWKKMNKSIYNGMQTSGELIGKMKIKRRANSLYKKLIKKDEVYDPLDVLDWVIDASQMIVSENLFYNTGNMPLPNSYPLFFTDFKCSITSLKDCNI